MVKYEEVVAAEVQVCGYLKWETHIATTHDFLNNYQAQGILFSTDYILARDQGQIEASDANSPDT